MSTSNSNVGMQGLNYFDQGIYDTGGQATLQIPTGSAAQSPGYVAQMNAQTTNPSMPGYTPTPAGFDYAGALGTFGSVAQGLGSLANAYTGYKNYQLAEDQFGFEKAATNRNIANQGLMVNNAYDNANAVGLALGGGAMTPEQIAASNAATKAKHVNTSAIG